MKKVVTMLMVLGLFASISFAQQQEKKGLGFEFHMFPSTLMSGEGGGALDVYFPIETTVGLLIEPSLSYYSYSSDTDYDDSSYDDYKSTSTEWSLVVGAFKLYEKEN